MKQLPCCIVLFALSAAAQSGANANMVRDRGSTRPSDQTQTLDRGRLGHQDAMPPGPLTFTGMLVDAGCRDRSSLNLRQPRGADFRFDRSGRACNPVYGRDRGTEDAGSRALRHHGAPGARYC